jgi:hypothetical protein
MTVTRHTASVSKKCTINGVLAAIDLPNGHPHSGHMLMFLDHDAPAPENGECGTAVFVQKVILPDGTENTLVKGEFVGYHRYFADKSRTFPQRSCLLVRCDKIAGVLDHKLPDRNESVLFIQ